MNFTRKFGVIANLIAGITFFVLLTGHQMEWISDDALSIVFINVILCTVYSITCLANLFRHKKIDSLGLPLLYSLWTISCFSLNLLFDVFENTTYWVYILLAIFFISSYWIYHQKEKHQKLAFYLNGVSFLLVIYFTVYLIPLIPISALVIILLGLGLHGFAPLLISILHISTLISKLNTEKINWYYFFSGIGSVLLLIGVFTILLNMESTKLVNSKTIFQFESNEELLDWVQISQRVKPNFINEILLKKGLVYNSIDEFWTMSRFDFGSSKQYNERKIHDPFILTCFSLTKDPSISKDDRIKILEANFDNRSQTEHQLWSGDNLETKAIKEDVYLFEKERLAYTELTMDIANNSKWGQGEAIYSFQLPEGAVATSLSLWVNGVERKGVLTSKSKAKKAYDQIVGVEARDPSLLQWREGNRIVCRIFPVTKEMPRQFKLGITSPFSMENNQMKYDNISIKGPSMAEAKIISRVRSKSLEKVSTSSKFDTEANQLIRSSQGYTKWNASLPRATLTPIHFQWKGFNYTVINPIYDTAQTDLSEVYFDLNSNWEETEIKKILGQLDPKFSCYTFINGEQVRIEKSNLKNIIKENIKYNYSLIPLHKISKEGFILTKMGNNSANFEELKESPFYDSLTKYKQKHTLYALNIGSEITPYWQTLSEQKYVKYHQTDMDKAIHIILHQRYPLVIEDANLSYIETSKVGIRKESVLNNNTKSNGSDHIYRMFAYRQVLNDFVGNAADTNAENYASLQLAEDANIVTPISSLVVLETDEDYKKHGIQKNENTLGNASMKNAGAVPEPHEWALLLLGIVCTFYIYKRRLLTK